jgi:hypothetical protein
MHFISFRGYNIADVTLRSGPAEMLFIDLMVMEVDDDQSDPPATHLTTVYRSEGRALE